MALNEDTLAREVTSPSYCPIALLPYCLLLTYSNQLSRHFKILIYSHFNILHYVIQVYYIIVKTLHFTLQKPKNPGFIAKTAIFVNFCEGHFSTV